MRLVDLFNKGDLIYGLTIKRSEAIAELCPRFGHDVAYTVDQYNSVCLATLLDIYTVKWSTTTESNFLNRLKERNTTTLQVAELLKHYEAIKDPSYSKVSVKNNEFPVNPKKLDSEQRKTRRACKARMLDSKTTIHFILDGLEVKHIFNEAYSLANTGDSDPKRLRCKYDSFTSAELRFAIKHYSELKDHIKFYFNDEETTLISWLQQQSRSAKESFNEWLSEKCSQKKIDSTTYDTFKIKFDETIEQKQNEQSPISKNKRNNSLNVKRKKLIYSEIREEPIKIPKFSLGIFENSKIQSENLEPVNTWDTLSQPTFPANIVASPSSGKNSV